MEFSNKSDVQNKYFNACCCCLQAGCFKEISSEYYSAGQKEVYGEMLNNTFNLQIYHQEGTTQRQLICELCVSRLRDAAVFRQMVSDSQEVIREHLRRLKSGEEGNTSTTNPLLEKSAIKVEARSLADPECEDDGAVDDFGDDETLADLKVDVVKESEGGRKSRTKSLSRRSKTKKCKIKAIREGSPQAESSEDWRKILERRGNGPILRDNSLKMLAHCTGCVFQWNKSRYRCFCCKEPFSDLTSLREHTNSKHTLEHIERKIISQQNRLVKVEISILNCKLCSENAENLTELRRHLVEKHEIKFVEMDDLLVPFKINNDLQCQICSEKFTMFRLLNIHMNRHYQKHVCHVCGAGFSNSVFLNLHKTRSHKPFHCKECDLPFTCKSDKKNHDISVHGVKFERKLRFPCPYCPQRFYQENFRVEHLVEKHGMLKPEYRCDVCAKVFITKSLCNNHVKTVHMKERNRACDICHKMFYSRSDVARHRVTHTGEKRFSCGLCGGPFATGDSLRRHKRRAHTQVQ